MASDISFRSELLSDSRNRFKYTSKCKSISCISGDGVCIIMVRECVDVFFCVLYPGKWHPICNAMPNPLQWFYRKRLVTKV